MSSGSFCSYLRTSNGAFSCALRNTLLHKAEVDSKCRKLNLAIICIDAYSSLYKAQELVGQKSTDAILWLIETATHFENLKENDNAIKACITAIDFAVELNLIDRAYELFRYARSVFERGAQEGDPSLVNTKIKGDLIKSGEKMISAAKKSTEQSNVGILQAELKAAVLGGAVLKKAEKDDLKKELVVVDGRQLYAKKSEEYKEGASKFIESGVIQNSIVFACMSALADLMLGKPQEGMAYLTETAAKSGFRDKFNEDPCFQWTKLVFRALVSRNQEDIERARTLFLGIPWAFKDDREFSRRVMESVFRRISQES